MSEFKIKYRHTKFGEEFMTRVYALNQSQAIRRFRMDFPVADILSITKQG